MFHRLVPARWFAALGAACVLLAAAPAQASPALIVQNGILTGATGVDVNGTLYTVSFADGTCAGVYGACDAAHFDFTNSADAQAAAQALLDQVFVDGPAGNFDSHPDLTSDCGAQMACVSLIACAVIPDGFANWQAFNYAGSGDDPVSSTNLYGLTTSGSASTNWAIFTAEPTGNVPEPGSLALVAATLSLLAVVTRRRA